MTSGGRKQAPAPPNGRSTPAADGATLPDAACGHLRAREYAETEAAHRSAAAARSHAAFEKFKLGNQLRESGWLAEALDAYRAATAVWPDYASCWYNLGITHMALGQADDAIEAYKQAVECRPDYAEAWNNMGSALRALGRIDEAEAALQRALAAKDFALPHFNRAGLLSDQGRTKEAIVALRKCLALQPELVSAGVQLAYFLSEHGQHAEAERVLRQLMQPNAEDGKAQRSILEALARLFIDQERLPEAVEQYEKILQTDPDHAEATAGLCRVKASMCDWRNRDEDFAHLMKVTERQLAAGERTALAAFDALARPLSPAMHLKIGRSWAEESKRRMAGWRRRLNFRFDRSRRHERLRIGYVSQDFRDHAVGHLTRTMYGLHDRSEFEIFGYAVRKSDSSIYRKTIEAGCEHFIDIHDIGLPQGAQRIHRDEIDIMVDLMGHTSGNRIGITALHPAPVTVGFLAYPGSSGADFTDYMLTDAVVTTPEDQRDYAERLVFLPNCFQPNDWTQEVDESPVTRAEFGLPDEAFVFSCFNNHFKLEPYVYDIWMRILRRVPNSVLWLLELNSPMARNLRREAQARGVSPERIVLSSKTGKARHLARQQLADLFLDTRYFNAHTTCSDSLWAGLPVLTCPGQSFAARVAASLLKAAGLPELIATDFADYERLAVHLATHPAELQVIRNKCAAQRTTSPLFDTKRFVRNLERAYRLIWDNWLAGNPPRQLFVTEA